MKPGSAYSKYQKNISYVGIARELNDLPNDLKV